MGGRACLRGMRVPVSVIVNQIAHGASFDEILAGYPDLEREEIQQAVEYVAWLAKRIPVDVHSIQNLPLNLVSAFVVAGPLNTVSKQGDMTSVRTSCTVTALVSSTGSVGIGRFPSFALTRIFDLPSSPAFMEARRTPS